MLQCKNKYLISGNRIYKLPGKRFPKQVAAIFQNLSAIRASCFANFFFRLIKIMKAQKKNGYNTNSQKKYSIFCTKLSHEVDLWYDESNMTDVTEVIKNFGL